MIRMELYVDNNQRITLNRYDDLNSVKKSLSLKSIEVYEYLKKISRVPIRKVHELPNNKDILLVHKDFLLDIKNYERVFERNGVKPILNNIKKYYEYGNLEKVKGKKVNRKNKYVNKKIAAIGLSIAIITGSFFVGTRSIDAKEMNTIDNVSSISSDTADFETTLNEAERISLSNVNHTSIVEDSVDPIFINYTDNSRTEKAFKTQSSYGHLIKKYSDLYGLDSELMTAVATQERGVHSEVIDAGGGFGLMQVQESVWRNKELTAYNFEKNEYETIVVDSEMLPNLEYNIKVGCMIFQNCLKYMDYNILASIQCYNMGYGNMKKILSKYASDTNRTIDEVLNDLDDYGWLDYRKMIHVGDQSYLENVLSWMGPNINLKNIKNNGEMVELAVNNQSNLKKLY